MKRPQESLFAEFGVSPPAVREAIHILESDGLTSRATGQRRWRGRASAVGGPDRADDQHGAADTRRNARRCQ